MTAPGWDGPGRIGAAVGVGIAVTEGLWVVLPCVRLFGAAGFWAQILPTIVAYAAVGAVVDAAVCGARRGPLVRAAVVGLVGVGVATAGGLPIAAAAWMMGSAAAWGLALAHRRVWPVAAAVGAWGLSPMIPRPARPDPPPVVAPARGPSVAVIVLDTLRLDRTSLGRTDRDTTPNLAALAARGTTFTRARSVSCWSLPAHASMLTGRWPAAHGADFDHPRLDGDLPVLGALLAGAGWETAAFSGNPLVAPGVGLGRGFQTFEEHWRTYTLRDALFASRLGSRLTAADRDKQGLEVVDAIRAWRASRIDDRPFFVFVNLFEAHVPYQEVPRAFRRRYATGADRALEALGERAHMAQVLGTDVDETDRAGILDLQDGSIAAADARLGDVIAALGPDVRLVVLSDHGEAYGERGPWGHNLGLEEELLRVPLVVAGPGVPVGVSDAAVSVVDVFPTVLGWAGLASPSDGADLFAPVAGRVLRAEHGPPDPFTSGWQWMRPFADHREIRAARWVVIDGDRKRSVVDGVRDEAFDLGRDPGERHPRAATPDEPASPSPWVRAR